VTATQYDSLGRQSKTIDALGNETRYVYDDLGRLWKVIDALGGVIEYGFDDRGNRTSVRDANGGVTTYQYDLENRLVSETNPIGITTTYTYTPTGRRATKTDGNGVTTTYTHTAEGRLARVDFPDGTFKEYRFDQRGRKVYEANQDVIQTYEFDDLNRVVAYTQTNIGGISKTLRFEFDANGNRSKMIDGEGGITTYEYDRNNRLVKLIDPDGDVTRLEYDAAGRRTKLILGNGVWAAYEYDPSSRVTSILYRSRTNEILMGFAYGHDLNGNRLYKRFADGTQESYSYDAANRLVHVTYRDGKFEDFTYDLLGNRIAHNKDGVVTTSTFNAFNQLLTVTNAATGEATSFAWDGNGNLLSETSAAGLKSYLWDFDNRLRKTVSPTQSAVFSYSAGRIRASKEFGGVRTDYVVDCVSVVAEYEAGIKKSAYNMGGRIDEIVSQSNDQGKFWYLSDELGSVVALTDRTGGVIETQRYAVWGERLPSDVTASMRNPYFWQGREADGELVYFRFRYFAWHVFLSPDPVRALNAYDAFEGNPVSHTDPYGLFSFGVDGSVAPFWNKLLTLYEIKNWKSDIESVLGPQTETNMQQKYPNYRLIVYMQNYWLPTSAAWHDDRLGTVVYDRKDCKKLLRLAALIDFGHHLEIYNGAEIVTQLYGTIVHELWHVRQILEQPSTLELIDKAYGLKPDTLLHGLIKQYEPGAQAVENHIIGKYGAVLGP
jgi:RHS repeat-associated protein